MRLKNARAILLKLMESLEGDEKEAVGRALHYLDKQLQKQEVDNHKERRKEWYYKNRDRILAEEKRKRMMESPEQADHRRALARESQRKFREKHKQKIDI